MAAVEELWEATHLPAMLLNFQDQEDVLDSPDGPDNGSSLSEEDYVEMFTEFPTSEDFIDVAMLAEETEENDDVAYVYEQDMVNALDNALNSALANYNFLHEEDYYLDDDVEEFTPVAPYTSTISTLDVTNAWDSWLEERNTQKEISKLETEILFLEEELNKVKHQKSLLPKSSAPSFLYANFPCRKRKIEEKVEEEEEEEFSTISEEEINGYFADEEDVDDNDSDNSDDDNVSDSESDSSESDSNSDSSSDESSDDSSDDDSSESSSESSEEESEEDSKTIYIPFKKRKVPISIFRQNRVKLVKAEQQDCEEDVDILN